MWVREDVPDVFDTTKQISVYSTFKKNNNIGREKVYTLEKGSVVRVQEYNCPKTPTHALLSTPCRGWIHLNIQTQNGSKRRTLKRHKIKNLEEN